jgi:hypothetical protein
MSELTEIIGQHYEAGRMPEALTWREAQRCFIVFQLGFFPFGAQPAITTSPVGRQTGTHLDRVSRL